MTKVGPEIEELATLVEDVSGNVIPPGHYPFLAQLASKRAAANGLNDVITYVKALAKGSLVAEWASLLPGITVKESYFFRTPQHFNVMEKTLLPQLVAAREQTPGLVVWSAGCARGEEPGTLALILAENPLVAGWDWRIVATDIDEEALAAARVGIYGVRALANVPQNLKEKYFNKVHHGHQLASELRDRIDYRTANLMTDRSVVVDGFYDLIFLRNVLIYFRPEAQKRIVSRLAKALAKDGFLFVGPTESLWKLSHELKSIELPDCYCYQHAERQEHHSSPTTHRRGIPPHPHKTLTGASHPPRHGEHPRVHPPLSLKSKAVITPSQPAAPTRPSHKPRPVETVLTDPRALLQRAVQMLNDNQLTDAQEVVKSILATDPASAEGRSLDGFIHDLAGRLDDAVTAYRAALFLDAGLFQVRLLLADALQRLGHHQRATHEYREILASLSSARARELTGLTSLPLADREHATRRCRHMLRQK